MTEIYKADIVYAPTLDLLEEIESGYIVVRNGEIEGVYDTLPEKYAKEKITELEGLLIPGMTDMHVHAPQYALRGVGFDLELLDWLDRYTFPGEAKFADEAFAKEIFCLCEGIGEERHDARGSICDCSRSRYDDTYG